MNNLHIKSIFFLLFFSLHVVLSADFSPESIIVARGEVRKTSETQTEMNRRSNAIVKLYSDAGIAVTEINDSALTPLALSKARLVIFPCNAPLPDANLQAVKDAVAKGCRLMVFYPQDKEICRLLGLKEPVPVAKDKFGKPTLISFNRIEGLPDSLEQPLGNAMLLNSLPSGGASPIGTFGNSDGSSTGLPAVIMHGNGFAFAQLLQIKNRPLTTRMMLALTATILPEIWEQPAKNLLNDIGVIGKCSNIAELTELIRAFSPGKHSQLLAQAIGLTDNAKIKISQGKFADAYMLAEQARPMAREAFLLVCRPRPNELRGAWIHSAYGISNWGWDKTIRVLKENGFNAIFANMLWGYIADYPSNVLPTHPDVEKKGDQLKLCLEACRKYGVELHVWKVCWNMGHRTPDALKKKMVDEKRTQVTFKGTQTSFLAPHIKENQDLEVAAFLEIIRNYDVDGIHMDYIRYAEEDCDYSDSARKAFETYLGKRVEAWPEDCGIGGKLRRKFNEWRRGNINRLVERVYKEAHALKPSINVSAAVFGGWDQAPHSNVAQQVETWIDNGWLDFVCPMNYTSDKEFFESLCRRQIDSVKSRIPVYIGIGSYLHPDSATTAEQISMTRELGGDGFVCFSHNPKFANEILPELAKGPTARFSQAPYPHHSPRIDWKPVLSKTPLMAESYAYPENVITKLSFPESFKLPKGSSARILCDGNYLPIQPQIGIWYKGTNMTCSFIPPRPGVYRLEISDDKTYVCRSPNLEVLSPEDVRQKKIAEGIPQFEKNGKPRVAVWLQRAFGASEIIKALEESQSYDVAPLQNLKPESLAACDAIVIPQPRKNAQLFLNPATAELLHQYVRNGGRLMVTHALTGIRGFNIICPEVTAYAKEPALNSSLWLPVQGHPICKDIPVIPQQSTFVDLIALTPGTTGKPFALDAASKLPVGVVGTCGKGRFAAWGIGLGIAKGDRDCPLTPIEKTTLNSIILWMLDSK